MYEYPNPVSEKLKPPTQTATHFISHLKWNGSNEIGVRRVIDGKVDNDSFSLIQHGWSDYEKAEQVVIMQLAKGHDVYRISRFMDWMKETGRIYLKARTA